MSTVCSSTNYTRTLMKYRYQLLLLFTSISTLGFSQKKVAITIDDAPNTQLYLDSRLQAPLLNTLDSLDIPAAIYFNEEQLYKTTMFNKNVVLLDEYIKRNYVTVGNHSFSHARYSESTLEEYKKEVTKGEEISKQFASKYDKKINSFRFPYNDLGKDSIQQVEIEKYLKSKGYTIAPFTVSSDDWMYDKLYTNYLAKKDTVAAKRIAKAYIINTMATFAYFDTIVQEQYGREIAHIYLCHDNKLNADYLDTLVAELRAKEYTFVSMEDALTDDVYAQENTYFKKWGVSWIYRWMTDTDKRSELMKAQPENKTILKEHEELMAEK